MKLIATILSLNCLFITSHTLNENLSKKNIKNRQVQEHLNIIAHEKAMRQLDSSFVSPFRSIQEQETLDAPKDPLYKKVA